MAGCLFFSSSGFISQKKQFKQLSFWYCRNFTITLCDVFRNLYAEFTLNLYYLVMSIYGWLYWKFGKRKTETAISETTNQEKLITVGIVVGTFSIFWYFLTQFTDSDVPILDSLVSAFAWAGMWLMARRKIENWVLLNMSNMIAIPLLIHKGLYLYAILTAFLFIVAISGYIEWRKIIKLKKNVAVVE